MNTNIGDYFQKVQPELSKRPTAKQPKGVFGYASRHIRRYTRFNDRRRLVTFGIAMLMLATAVLPSFYGVLQHRKYMLSEDTSRIIGHSSEELAKKLVYDEERQAYVFNKEKMPFDLPNANTDSQAADQVAAVRLLNAKAASQDKTAKIGGSSAKDDQLYASQFPKDFARGATYYDTEAQSSFSLIPKFTGMYGDLVDGRLVYPLTQMPGQAIYTVKADGVKEDVVLQKYAGDTVTLDYTLKLPKTLQARLLDTGDIGIYSADPSIYGASVLSKDTDMTAALKAQETAAKNHLAFVIPAPLVTEADGDTTGVHSKFTMVGEDVAVVTTGLAKASYPLSIDPTVVVTSSTDFKTGNNEGMADLTASDQISRGGLTGGGIPGGWSSTTSFSTARRYFASLAYNGYMYILGGTTGTSLSDVQYAPINANGTIGTWNTTTSLTSARNGLVAVPYNGYMYVLGGNDSTTVEYAPINANGTIGTWNTTTSFTTGRDRHRAAVYNGYLYVFSGEDSGGTSLSDVQYAPINANGTIGTWNTTTSLTSARFDIGSIVYNGYLYVLGGFTTTRISTVQYAPINADGTLGVWTSTTSLSAARRIHSTVVYNGYVYTTGGETGGTGAIGTVEYAPINANGTIGTWTASSGLATARYAHNSVAYNGYLYAMGGTVNPGNLNDVQYAKISDPGYLNTTAPASGMMSTTRERHATAVWNGQLYELGGVGGANNNYVNYVQRISLNSTTGDTTGSETVDTGFSGNRADLAAVAYDGYLYQIGGFTSDGSTDTYYNDVRYHAIASDGAITGAWSNATNLTTARAGIDAAAYNGYMYVVGGRDASGNISEVRYATINSNGSLGASWSTTTALPSAMNRMRIVIHGGYMYVMGGATHALPSVGTGSSPSGSRATGAGSTGVYYAPINSNGTLGSWTAASSMNEARAEFGATAYNGYLYAAGGAHNTTARMSVEFAKINNNGTVGTWQYAADLPGGNYNRVSASMEVYNGYVYLVAGRQDTGIANSSRTSVILYGLIDNGGSGNINSWTTSSNVLPAGRSNAASVQINGYAYVIGGAAVSNYYYAPLNRDGTVGSWSSAQTFPVTLTGASAVTSGGYIYVIGGNTTSVYYAKPNANGSISSWTSTSSLPAAVQYGGAVVAAGKVYMVGGAVGSTSQTTVYVAHINEDYSLGSWQTEANSLPAARHYTQPVVMNGYMYVVGGYNGTSSQQTTYYTKIDSSGSLGVWVSAANLLPTANSGATTIAANGYIYNISGVNDANIYYTSVSNTGWISPWQLLNSIPSTRSYGTGVYANGYLYVFGGSSSTSVYYASVNSIARIARYSKMVDLGTNTNLQAVGFTGLNTDGISLSTRAASLEYVFGTESYDATNASYAGTLNPWGSTSTLSVAREGGGMATLKGYMYYIGGYTTTAVASVYYTKANGDGTVGAWSTTTALPVFRDGCAAKGFNDYVYCIGGNNGSGNTSTVYYAKPNSDGTITSWSTTTALGQNIGDVRVTTLNGYMYVTNSNDEVWYGKVNANGTISSWTYSWDLVDSGSRAVGGGFVTSNGYLYYIGGVLSGGGGGASSGVFYSGVNADGSLTGFVTSSNSLPVGRYNGAAFAYGGYIYHMTGQEGGNVAQSDIYYAKVNSDGSTSSWATSSVVAPDGGRVWPGYTIANGYLYLVAGYNGSNKNTAYYTNVKRLWGDTVNNVRYAQVTVTIDDTTANSGYGENLQGVLNGIYLDYRIVPPPTYRLRGGKFFVDGTLQPLIQPNTNNN